MSNAISNLKDFFISYNSADKDRAEWIAWQLEDAEYATVIQAWEFGPGQNFFLAMQKAAIEARRTISVLSPDYLDAKFTSPEWIADFVLYPAGRDCSPVDAYRVCSSVGATDKNEARDRLTG